jgi:hypothetical protein
MRMLLPPQKKSIGLPKAQVFLENVFPEFVKVHNLFNSQ